LLAIDPEGLSLEQDIDRRLLIGIVRSDINTGLKQRRWENDAALYIPGSALGREAYDFILQNRWHMDADAAVAFLVEKVRFEPYAAELEVGMYIREPTYVLGYLIGMQEIESIRAEYIALYGDPEPPSKFYDRCCVSVRSRRPCYGKSC